MKNTFNWPQPANPSDGPFVFVSYCHANHKVLQADLKRMSSLKIALWYDRAIIPSEDWYQKAKSAMTHPNCVGAVFYVSKQSLNSYPCYRELKLACQLKKQRNFQLCSVNIGGKTIEEMSEPMDIPQVRKKLYKRAFNNKVIFVPRSATPQDLKHEKKLLLFYDACKLLNIEYKSLLEDNAFLYKETEQGLVVTKYTGALSELVVPSYLDGMEVVGIGPMAFAGNNTVTKVVVEDGITSLDPYAFCRCKNLVEVEIPDSVRQIGYECFRECVKLRQVVLPANLQVLGDYAFYLCYALQSVDFGNAPVSVGYACFSQCISLANIKLSPNTRQIRGYAFGGCIMQQLELPCSPQLQSLGEDVCVCNENLQYVVWKGTSVAPNMPKSLYSLCPNLQGVLVPFNMDEQSANVLKTYGAVKKYLPQVGRLSHDEKGFVWDAVPCAVGYLVEVDGKTFNCTQNRLDFAFEHSKYTVKITAYSNEDSVNLALEQVVKINTAIVENQTLLGGGIVYGTLDANKLPVKRVAKHAYHTDFALQKFVSGQIERVESGAFEMCTRLTHVVLQNNCHLGDNAFAKCTELATVDGLEHATFGKGVFAECVGLTAIDLGNVKHVPERLLYRCHNLVDVNLHGVETIGKESLRGCMALDVSVVPHGVKVIEQDALSYICISSISLPSTLEIFAKGNLQHCTYLESIEVQEGCKNFHSRDGVLYQGNTLLRYPPAKRTKHFVVDGVQTVGESAFVDQVYVEQITLAQCVQTLQNNALYNCDSLQCLVTEGNVVFGQNSLANCDKLQRICVSQWTWEHNNWQSVGLKEGVEVCIL